MDGDTHAVYLAGMLSLRFLVGLHPILDSCGKQSSVVKNLWRASPSSLVIHVFDTKTRPSYICQIFFGKEFEFIFLPLSTATLFMNEELQGKHILSILWVKSSLALRMEIETNLLDLTKFLSYHQFSQDLRFSLLSLLQFSSSKSDSSDFRLPKSGRQKQIRVILLLFGNIAPQVPYLTKHWALPRVWGTFFLESRAVCHSGPSHVHFVSEIVKMQPSSQFHQSFNLFATLVSRAETGYGEKHLAQSTSLPVVVIINISCLAQSH